MGTRLFIGNLSYNVNEQELREAFSGEGIEVRSVRVALDRDTGRPRGFAFVETATDEGAKASIEKLSGRLMQGRAIIIEEAQAKPMGGARPTGGPPARRRLVRRALARRARLAPVRRGPRRRSGWPAARGVVVALVRRVLRAAGPPPRGWRLRRASRSRLRPAAVAAGASIRASRRGGPPRGRGRCSSARTAGEEALDPPQAGGARARQLALERQSRRGLRPAARRGAVHSVFVLRGDA